MYYRHFALDGPPFRFTPSAAVLYMSSAHRECLAALEWALLHDECGFMLLVGETGTGKTTLLNAVIARRIQRLHLACVTNPRLSFQEIMRVVLPQLGVVTDERGKLELIQAFERAVANQPEGHRTAIVIDEAQNLSDDNLEDLRLLANRFESQERELQFVLMGHPELLERLSTHNLRQLRERISTKVSLPALSLEESGAYVECRLAAQGGSARIFDAKALQHLVSAAGGIPRRLNVLCHNALVLAYSKNANTVTMPMAREVVSDYESLLGASPAKPARTLFTAKSLFMTKSRRAEAPAKTVQAPAPVIPLQTPTVQAPAPVIPLQTSAPEMPVRTPAPAKPIRLTETMMQAPAPVRPLQTPTPEIPVRASAAAKPIRLPEEAVVRPQSIREQLLTPRSPESAIRPNRHSIYAAGACAAVLVIAVGGFLIPRTQNWANEINRAVPAIAGMVSTANAEVPPKSSDNNATVDPAVGDTTSVASTLGYTPPVAPAQQIAPVATTAVAEHSTEPASSTRRAEIRIRPGDTFHDLAVKYLGSKDRAWDLIKANPQISDPDSLYVGEVVYLPSTQNSATPE